MKDRFHRLVITMMSKKIVAWVTGSIFLWYDKIAGAEWVLLTAAVFTLDLATKMKVGINGNNPSN